MRSWSTFLSITVLLLIGGGWGGRQLLIERAERSISEHRAEITTLKACSVYQQPPPPTPHPWGGENFWDLVHPALDALWMLQQESANSVEFSRDLMNDPELSEESLMTLKAGGASFEACRQAVKRPVRDWKGTLDEFLPSKGQLMGKGLCLKGLLAWRQGRDAEAVDWILTALTVAHATSQGDEIASMEMLWEVERWACETGRLLLSKHGLSAAQLDDFGRRLGWLMQTRPRSPRRLRSYVATTRGFVLQGPGNPRVNVEPAGWKDLYSPSIQMARILTGLRDAAERAATLPCASSAELQSQWTALGSRYRKDDVERIWLMEEWYWQELEALLRLDLLRIAVGVARFEAELGRMPRTLDEAGVEGIAARPVQIEGRALVVRLLQPGETQSRFESAIEPGERQWTIRRR
jgi:hypothetical protein